MFTCQRGNKWLEMLPLSFTPLNQPFSPAALTFALSELTQPHINAGVKKAYMRREFKEKSEKALKGCIFLLFFFSGNVFSPPVGWDYHPKHLSDFLHSQNKAANCFDRGRANANSEVTQLRAFFLPSLSLPFFISPSLNDLMANVIYGGS